MVWATMVLMMVDIDMLMVDDERYGDMAGPRTYWAPLILTQPRPHDAPVHSPRGQSISSLIAYSYYVVDTFVPTCLIFRLPSLVFKLPK
jgi:hypothetical protein